MGWRTSIAAGLCIMGLGADVARAETAEQTADEAATLDAAVEAEAGATPANLRWDERPSYNRGNGWWPPSYGDNQRRWRPRSYGVRPYWYDRSRYGAQWRTPHARWPDTRWPEARYGSNWVPRYGWPGTNQPYRQRSWDRDRYGNVTPDWRYGYVTGWSRSDAWR